MRYHVIYLAAGQRETIDLEAADAASAVATVATLPSHEPTAFELLSVVPDPVQPPAPTSQMANAD